MDYQEPQIAQKNFQPDDIQNALAWLGKGSSSSGAFGGYVNDDGTAVSLPAGWTSAKTGTGAYTVTHNLGSTAYIVVALAAGATFGVCSLYAINANDFHLSIVSIAGSSQDTDFTFILLPTA